jgi:hypothetical protein
MRDFCMNICEAAIYRHAWPRVIWLELFLRLVREEWRRFVTRLTGGNSSSNIVSEK